MCLVTLRPHDEIYADQGSNCLLADDVLAVGQLSDEAWDVLAQACTAHVRLRGGRALPVIVLLERCGLALHVVARVPDLQVLGHADDQVDD